MTHMCEVIPFPWSGPSMADRYPVTEDEASLYDRFRQHGYGKKNAFEAVVLARRHLAANGLTMVDDDNENMVFDLVYDVLTDVPGFP